MGQLDSIDLTRGLGDPGVRQAIRDKYREDAASATPGELARFWCRLLTQPRAAISSERALFLDLADTTRATPRKGDPTDLRSLIVSAVALHVPGLTTLIGLEESLQTENDWLDAFVALAAKAEAFERQGDEKGLDKPIASQAFDLAVLIGRLALQTYPQRMMEDGAREWTSQLAHFRNLSNCMPNELLRPTPVWLAHPGDDTRRLARLTIALLDPEDHPPMQFEAWTVDRARRLALPTDPSGRDAGKELNDLLRHWAATDCFFLAFLTRHLRATVRPDASVLKLPMPSPNGCDHHVLVAGSSGVGKTNFLFATQATEEGGSLDFSMTTPRDAAEKKWKSGLPSGTQQSGSTAATKPRDFLRFRFVDIPGEPLGQNRAPDLEEDLKNLIDERKPSAVMLMVDDRSTIYVDRLSFVWTRAVQAQPSKAKAGLALYLVINKMDQLIPAGVDETLAAKLKECMLRPLRLPMESEGFDRDKFGAGGLQGVQWDGFDKVLERIDRSEALYRVPAYAKRVRTDLIRLRELITTLGQQALRPANVFLAYTDCRFDQGYSGVAELWRHVRRVIGPATAASRREYVRTRMWLDLREQLQPLGLDGDVPMPSAPNLDGRRIVEAIDALKSAAQSRGGSHYLNHFIAIDQPGMASEALVAEGRARPLDGSDGHLHEIDKHLAAFEQSRVEILAWIEVELAAAIKSLGIPVDQSYQSLVSGAASNGQAVFLDLPLNLQSFVAAGAEQPTGSKIDEAVEAGIVQVLQEKLAEHPNVEEAAKIGAKAVRSYLQSASDAKAYRLSFDPVFGFRRTGCPILDGPLELALPPNLSKAQLLGKAVSKNADGAFGPVLKSLANLQPQYPQMGARRLEYDPVKSRTLHLEGLFGSDPSTIWSNWIALQDRRIATEIPSLCKLREELKSEKFSRLQDRVTAAMLMAILESQGFAVASFVEDQSKFASNLGALIQCVDHVVNKYPFQGLVDSLKTTSQDKSGDYARYHPLVCAKTIAVPAILPSNQEADRVLERLKVADKLFTHIQALGLPPARTAFASDDIDALVNEARHTASDIRAELLELLLIERATYLEQTGWLTGHPQSGMPNNILHGLRGRVGGSQSKHKAVDVLRIQARTFLDSVEKLTEQAWQGE